MDETKNPELRALIFGASLRRESLNARLAELAARIAEQHGATIDLAKFEEFTVPPYDGDADTGETYPKGAELFAKRLSASDALIIASPEYNASMPGALKNLIDWVSRMRPQPFDEKHILLMSASPSMVGGNRGLWALRVPLEHLGARVFPDMFSLATAHTAFEGPGLANQSLMSRFDKNIAAFLSLVEAARHYPCIKRAWVEFLGEPDIHPGPSR